MAKPMTLKDVRDGLSRMFAEDRSLEEKEINHILIEDVHGVNHYDYMKRDDDSDVVEDDDDEYGYDDEDDYDYDDDDEDSELEEESWESEDDDSDLEESY